MDEKESIEEDKKALNELFVSLIGADVEFTDSMPEDNFEAFDLFIKKLEDSIYAEDMASIYGGVKLSKIIDPLWYVIENLIIIQFGKAAYEVIMWFLLYRIDEEGNEVSWIDEDEDEFTIKTTQQLYDYIIEKY